MEKVHLKILQKYFFPQPFDYLKPHGTLTPEEEAELKRVGIDPYKILKLSHDTVIKRLRALAPKLNRKRVAEAFVASLGPHAPVAYRGPLAAYALAHKLPDHRFKRHPSYSSDFCVVCGMEKQTEVSPARVLCLQQREGVYLGHNDLATALHLLEQFHADPAPPAATADDYQRLREILKFIESLPEKTTGTQLSGKLGPFVAGNKYSRDYVVEALGYCGLLPSDDHPGYWKKWVEWIDQDSDMHPPAAWWRGRNGLNRGAAKFWFPKV